MRSSTSSYSFDGTCELSKNADFTLTFDDESFLKMSKCLLELASPVFETAIGAYDNNGTLHLSETSKDAWILILNFVHPRGRFDIHAEAVASDIVSTLIDALRQCEKYGFARLQQVLDTRIASCIDSLVYALAPLSPFEREIPSFVRLKQKYVIVDPNLELFKAVRIFDLPQSEEAMTSYLISVIKENNSRMKARQDVGKRINRRRINKAMGRVSEIVTQMRANARHRLCSLFAQKIVDAQLCVSIDFVKLEGTTVSLFRSSSESSSSS